MTITAEQAAKLLEGTTTGWELLARRDGSILILTRNAVGSPHRHIAEMSWGVDEPGNGAGDAKLAVAAPDLARALIASEAARKLAEERLAALIRRAHDAIIRDEKDGAVWAQLLADMAKEIDNG